MSPDPTKSIDAPFGSWQMDRNETHLQNCKFLSLAAHGFIAVIQDKYVVKVYDDNVSAVRRELRMMILAGDCSVTPLGRLFNEEKLCGIVMPYETSLVPPSTDPLHVPIPDPTLSKDTRLKMINQLCALVSRLHSEKGILHGDIKPSNLLMCSDGELRLCDFGCAFLESEAEVPRALSTRYTSPYLCRMIPLAPLSRAEDLYATGVSIWEIYTGLIPFGDIVDE